MSQVINVPLTQIDANPCRLLAAYPYVEDKLDALRRSMTQDGVGFIGAIEARKKGDRFQIAYGHHRLRAASQVGLKSVPLIVLALDDKQMLQRMGRENLDEYSASFPVLLETWEAAAKFLTAVDGKRVQAIDIARLLGWTRPHVNGVSTTSVADACHAAHQLIEDGHLERDTLAGLSTSAARDIVTRAQARMNQLDKLAAKTNRPAKEVAQAKRHIAKAVKETAKDVRDGKVAQRDIRSTVDVKAYKGTKGEKVVTPLFAAFGKALADGISVMLNKDAAAAKLQNVVEALGMVTLDTDKEIVKRIRFDLGQLGERVETWDQRLAAKPKAASVTPLKLLGG